MNTAPLPDQPRQGDRALVILSATAVAAAVLQLVLAIVWIVTRPPCPDGSVRLLDIEPVIVFGGWALAFWPALVMLIIARMTEPGGRIWLLRAVSIGCMVVALLLVDELVHDLIVVNTQQYDQGCWSY